MADSTYQPRVYRRQGGNEMVVAAGGAITVEPGGAINVFAPQGNLYFVDANTGSDGNDGLSWAAPFATIGAAISASNATVDWGKYPKRFNSIFVAPGEYAEKIGSFYCAHIVGLGTLGTGHGVSIKPATGPCVTSSGITTGATIIGGTLTNLNFVENTAGDAHPLMFLKTFNDAVIQGCKFSSGGNATAGIKLAGVADGFKEGYVRDCKFQSGSGTLAYSIYATGGANCYLHNVLIENNIIVASTTGIHVEATCTATGSVIRNNTVRGATNGIVDLNGNTFVVNNYLAVATDAINHAGGARFTVGNHVVENVTGGIETAGS